MSMGPLKEAFQPPFEETSCSRTTPFQEMCSVEEKVLPSVRNSKVWEEGTWPHSARALPATTRDGH